MLSFSTDVALSFFPVSSPDFCVAAFVCLCRLPGDPVASHDGAAEISPGETGRAGLLLSVTQQHPGGSLPDRCSKNTHHPSIHTMYCESMALRRDSGFRMEIHNENWWLILHHTDFWPIRCRIIQMFLPLNTICAAFILGHDRGCVYSHPVLALNFCRSVKHTHTHSFLQLCISDDSAEMRFPLNQSLRMCVDFISMCVRNTHVTLIRRAFTLLAGDQHF